MNISFFVPTNLSIYDEDDRAEGRTILQGLMEWDRDHQEVDEAQYASLLSNGNKIEVKANDGTQQASLLSNSNKIGKDRKNSKPTMEPKRHPRNLTATKLGGWVVSRYKC